MMDKTRVYQHRPSFRLRMYRFFMASLSRLFPYYAAERAWFLWFQTPRYKEPLREKNWRKEARLVELHTNTHKIITYHWSGASAQTTRQRPTIVLMHGWSGRATQMGAFMHPLLDAGFDVVAFDAPGHGRSSGNSATFFEIEEALQEVCQHIDHVAGVIAHSCGVLVATYALRHWLVADRVILISSPTDMMYLVNRFCNSIYLNAKACRYFQEKLEQRFDTSIWSMLSADENARELATPALIIHDRQDRDVPVQLGQRLADAWPGSEIFFTRGLGHTRILRDPQVIQRTVAFLSGL